MWERDGEGMGRRVRDLLGPRSMFWSSCATRDGLDERVLACGRRTSASGRSPVVTTSPAGRPISMKGDVHPQGFHSATSGGEGVRVVRFSVRQAPLPGRYGGWDVHTICWYGEWTLRQPQARRPSSGWWATPWATYSAAMECRSA